MPRSPSQPHAVSITEQTDQQGRDSTAPLQLSTTTEAKLHYLAPASRDHSGTLLGLLEP